MINIISSSRYKINRKNIKTRVLEIINKIGISPEMTLNIIFVGKNKMTSLSLSYKKERAALPVLTFPYESKKIDDEKLLGEILVCYPQAVLLAAERNKKVEEIIIELIKHGIENLIN